LIAELPIGCRSLFLSEFAQTSVVPIPEAICQLKADVPDMKYNLIYKPLCVNDIDRYGDLRVWEM
jgi:hypothetical protein